MRFIVDADLNRLFSFTAGGDTMRALAAACEAYAEAQMDRRYKTLDIYHSLVSL
jgi:DNA repair protein RecO (recombination protein O)